MGFRRKNHKRCIGQLSLNAKRMRLKRQQETPEQRQARLARNREFKQIRRAEQATIVSFLQRQIKNELQCEAYQDVPARYKDVPARYKDLRFNFVENPSFCVGSPLCMVNPLPGSSTIQSPQPPFRLKEDPKSSLRKVDPLSSNSTIQNAHEPVSLKQEPEPSMLWVEVPGSSVIKSANICVKEEPESISSVCIEFMEDPLLG